MTLCIVLHSVQSAARITITINNCEITFGCDHVHGEINKRIRECLEYSRLVSITILK